ncbi:MULTISPECIES: TetR/AcrR family transcriptional regulator [Streptomyces]|uniref:Transcriptional regulator, TetR family n=1 Tax=Streptomyces griseoaurantiacus TaxID=68213 RepID=A0A1G7IPL5_9ACTN|nr:MULTISPECIES: TetR/AcrR family transcriptional regulator [Streptomyces]MDX3087015.1 TetR/AcrR family transcriptional regulator [Streptomyces sp. ME12-02E]MDX3330588.1 TetR/AcrR family transcriptional regulator [Streptomyces sp. ME02-6978a]SDF14249.1 transcriptional regulator, TetR family [Streptomyces jietaisiensis]
MTAPARTQKQRREEAEAALLDAAAELVAEQGLRALTLARVGERAGYSRGLVTHYFGSKQALVERLARAAQSGFVPGLADLPPGPDRLLRLIDGYLAQQTKHERPLNRAFLLLWMEAATSPDLARLFADRTEAFRTDLREDLTAGIAEGTIRPDLPVEETTAAIVAQLRGIAIQLLVTPESLDLPALRVYLTDHWRRALTGGGR